MWTHARRIGPLEWHVFNMTTCDRCGKECQEGCNDPTLKASENKIRSLGMKIVTEEPDQLVGYSEKFGGAVCEACYNEVGE